MGDSLVTLMCCSVMRGSLNKCMFSDKINPLGSSCTAVAGPCRLFQRRYLGSVSGDRFEVSVEASNLQSLSRGRIALIHQTSETRGYRVDG